MEEVDANPGLIFDKLDGWLDGFFRLLPNIGVALVVAVVFWFLVSGNGHRRADPQICRAPRTRESRRGTQRRAASPPRWRGRRQ